jgi:hypothetical protein
MGMKSTLAEMHLKSRIDISDMMNGDEIDLILYADLPENLIKLSPFLASAHERTCGIKGEFTPLERNHVTSHLFLFFEEESSNSLFGKKGSSG